MQLQKILKFYTVLLSVPLLEKIKKNKKKLFRLFGNLGIGLSALTLTSASAPVFEYKYSLTQYKSLLE